MRKKINNLRLDGERALYGLRDTDVSECVFAGPADGESALKECRNISVESCSFELRYPLWHADGFKINNCNMTDTARAALWYGKNGKISQSNLGGIKAVRECNGITFEKCCIVSPEFGWKSKNISLESCDVKSEYFMFESSNLQLDKVSFEGKYSFQYVENAVITDSRFHTKDAFWHSKNITVKNTVLKGEYLGWYSQGLTLENCVISGTQPLCYCKDLRLINCRMENCDLAFEYSDVVATVEGKIDSVKNIKSGSVTADEVGEVINDGSVINCSGEVIIKRQAG